MPTRPQTETATAEQNPEICRLPSDQATFLFVELSATERIILGRSTVPHMMFSYDERVGDATTRRTGAAVTQESGVLEELLRVVGREADSFETTTKPNVIRVALKQRPVDAVAVHILTPAYAEIQDVVRSTIGAATQRSVWVQSRDLPDTRSVDSANQRVEVIFPATDRSQSRSTRTILGVQLPHRVGAVAAPGQGYQILDGEHVVAEIIGLRVYVLVMFSALAQTTTQMAIIAVLEKAAEYLSASEEERAELLRVAQEAHLQRLRDVYTNYVRGLITVDSTRLQEAVNAGRQRLEEIERNFEQALQMYQNNERQLRLLQEDDQSLLEDKAREFDRIRNLSRIDTLSVENNLLTLVTHSIVCEDERSGVYHSIGKLRINLNLREGRGPDNIRIHNLTRTVRGMSDGMHTPHVFAAGDMCPGTLTHSLTELLTRLEIEQAVVTLIEWLESANTNDTAGYYVYRWPIATQEELDRYGLAQPEGAQRFTPDRDTIHVDQYVQENEDDEEPDYEDDEEPDFEDVENDAL